MKKLLASALLAATLVVGTAGAALAHHVVGISVQASCEGYSGSAELNVFGNHSYRVTAPGFDSGVITEPGQNHNVTVPFSGTATAGVVDATIYNGANGTGGVEAHSTKSFATEGECPIPVSKEFRVGAQMQVGTPVAPVTITCTGNQGDTVYARVLRAPRALAVKLCGTTVRFAAKPRGTVMRITGPGLNIETWSRKAGRSAIRNFYAVTL